ncbi:MAG: FAD binding domain-containing protein [Betaproteobacteria bacterium]|nr:FAD binding domain-containing protein [Betaproteobacteria bacterium]
MPEFDLLAPQSVTEALDLLATYKDRVTVMAGGTDVLVAMKSRFRTETVMILSGISGMDYIEYDATAGLRIGALATVGQLLDHADVKKKYRALWEAADIFATPQLRNTATVVGNLLRASPAGDCSCAIYAIGGKLLLQSKTGRREVDVDDLWLSYGVTARMANELAVELLLPAVGKDTRTAFQRVTRVNEDLAKLNMAVRLDMSGKICKTARVAMGCVGPTPRRLTGIEGQLEGREITEAVLQKAADTVASEISPIDDIRSTAEYRRDVAGVFLRRTIQQACAGAR